MFIRINPLMAEFLSLLNVFISNASLRECMSVKLNFTFIQINAER